MVLGRIIHYAVDAVLVSTVIAGVRRSSGFSCVGVSSLHRCMLLSISFCSPDIPLLSDSTFRSVADRFLGVGETVFDVIQASAVNSSYFKRDGRGSK